MSHFVKIIKNYPDGSNELSNLWGRLKISSQNFQYLFIIIFVGLIINIAMTASLPVRLDEPYTMMTTAHGPVYAVEKSLNFEEQPPLYFFFVSLWRNIDHSLTWTRLFSVAFYPLIVLLSFFLAKEYIPGTNPHLFSAIVAFNPFILTLTSYARGYSLVLFLSELLFVLYYKAYLSGDFKKKYRICFFITAIISLYTQYYFGFVLLAAGLSLFLLRGKNAFRFYVIDMILPVLSLFALLPILPSQVNNVYDPSNKFTTVFGYLHFIYRTLEIYIMPLNQLRVSFIVRSLFGGIILITFAYSVYKIIKTKAAPNKNSLAIVLVLIFSFIFFFSILYIFGSIYIMPKHTAVVIIPMLLILYVFINLLNEKKTRLVWYIIIFVVFSGSIIKNYAAFKEEPTTLIEAAAYVKMNEAKGETIFLYNYLLQKFWPYYYDGSNTVIGLPESIDTANIYNVSNWAYHNTEDIKNNWKQYKDLKTFWLITNKSDENPGVGVNFNYQLLDDYVENNFIIISRKNFGRFEITKLSLTGNQTLTSSYNNRRYQ